MAGGIFNWRIWSGLILSGPATLRCIHFWHFFQIKIILEPSPLPSPSEMDRLHKLSSSSAPGVDGIPGSLLSHFAAHILDNICPSTLRHLFALRAPPLGRAVLTSTFIKVQEILVSAPLHALLSLRLTAPQGAEPFCNATWFRPSRLLWAHSIRWHRRQVHGFCHPFSFHSSNHCLFT